MKDINVIDSSQAHLRVQYASIVKFICQKCDTAVVIDSEPHLIGTCKTSFLFASLVVCVHIGYSAFLFYTPTIPLVWLHIRYKTVLFSEL